MDIKEALSQLDTMDDELWTGEGLPKVDAVEELVGEKVTRQDILDAAPQFTRENPVVEVVAQPNEEGNVEEPVETIALGDLENVELIGMDAREFAELLGTVAGEDLDALLEHVNSLIIDANAAIETAKTNAKLIAQASTQISNRIKVERPDMTNQQAIKAAIASGHKARAERAKLTKEALKGLSAKDLDPRAPIDKAFARKNTRGTQRPTQ